MEKAHSVVTNTRRGDLHRWSTTIIPTTREAPTDAEVPSHVFLHRAGFIRPVGAGIYDYLPLAWRVINKVSGIIRDELNATGASEMLMPALEPFELFKETKRDETYGDNLFRVKDRKGRMNALAPTHEEVITELMKGVVTSYTQLPITLYQIQTKFRDEARPRAGLLRCREFLMKDAYSFHMQLEGAGGLNDTYDAMFRAYSNVFARCGLDYLAVEAESGPIGGSASHEFMVRCASGEDTVLRCAASGYAANVEKCEIGERTYSFAGTPAGELVKHHTPSLPGIQEVAGVLKVTPAQMLKTIVFKVAGAKAGAVAPATLPLFVLAVVRGDHDVNEGKIKAASGCELVLADPKEAVKFGFAIGYVSPKIAADARCAGKVMVVVDPDAAQGGTAWATGADEPDYHVTGFNWNRELGALLNDATAVKVADVRNAVVGDPSPRAKGGVLHAEKGIEVGHIFKLGTKYSEAMGLQVLDEKQVRRAVIMGCYGIGVSRTMAACVEMSHDNDGIIWPVAIAPYHVLVTVMKPELPELAKVAHDLAAELSGKGVDVLVDDRMERPGVKFKDADLIGIPIRITIGEKSLAEGSIEYKMRKVPGKGELVKLDAAVQKCLDAINGA